MKGKVLSHVRLFAAPWTGAHQVPPSMGFSRQEYWSGVPLLSLEIFPTLDFHENGTIRVVSCDGPLSLSITLSKITHLEDESVLHAFL